jgi:hypothetical protein
MFDWLLAYFTDDPRVAQAVVAGMFLALGWIVTGWQNRRAAQRLRDARMNDVQKAIFAEIAAYIEVLQRDNLERYSDQIVRKMRDTADSAHPFIPLIPTENNDSIFHALAEDISILPRVSIDPIVVYYSQLKAIEALIHDLRAPSFADLEPERRIKMYRDYIALKIEALDLGLNALDVIKTVSNDGPDQTTAYMSLARFENALSEKKDIADWLTEKRINNPGAGPSGQ